MDSVVWGIVVAVASALGLVLLFTLVGLALRFARRGPVPDSGSEFWSGSSSGSLVRGFGYLCPDLGTTPRRADVQHRLSRALERIELVDPYAAPRRIGVALLETGPFDLPDSALRETHEQTPPERPEAQETR